METRVSRLGQGPGLAWKRNTSSFPPGSLAELQEWTGGKTEPVVPPWHDELTFQQWNTIGWAITDDGVLCIKPWKGSAGETGPVTNYTGAPWYDQRSKIRKIESTGTIVLNENSAYLFYWCSNLTDITTTLEDWDVSEVTNMSGMFYGCSSLTNLTPLANWDVSNVTSMYYMFAGCSSLRDLNALANWEVSSVESMGNMFDGCSNLTDLSPLAVWDVSNVANMSGMFYGCSNLTDLSALTNWDVSKVTNTSGMFYGCSSLTDLSALTNWRAYNVTDMRGMFYGCSNLTDLDALKYWEVSSVTSMGGMFQNCSSLTDLSALADWDVSSVTNMSRMFYGCSNLQKIGIPSIANSGQKLVENAEAAALTTVLPSIISEDGSMGPYTWDEIYTEMTTNPGSFQEGTMWVRASEEAE